ncbi:MAG: ribosome-associated translation inhibitor RaiA [Candidatus Firestonebacteria bacterium]|nr:ribosome-associated translation inhibitor RaiA [Candidatus Firestonebacteria bacterium]
MHISITGRHIDITNALRDYIEKKVSKLNKYFNHIIETHVVLSLDGKTYQVVEVTIHTNGITIHGEERTEDMYASVDKVVDKMERQIIKYKEKISQHNPRPSLKKLHITMNIMRSDSTNDNEGHSYKIIKTKKFAVKPMSLDEAVMQMDLLGDDFLVFTNANSDNTNVIYRRKDGTYGLIEKEY